MTILVTGATGQLGSLIIDSLIARGTAPAQIVAAGRNADALAALATRGVATATLDYTKPGTIAAALDGVDTVMLVSGSEIGQRAIQHANVIDAAKAAGVSRIVYTSAPQATTSALILAPEHKATEEAILASGLTFTILRNGWYTENYVAQVAEAENTGAIAASVGDGRVASASRKDYADAAAVVLTEAGHENAVYELSGDVAWSFEDLATTLANIIGKPVVYRALSPEEHHAALIVAGLDEGTAGFVVALDGNIRDGLLAATSGDLARIIGRPTTPLEQGLREAIA